jgi:flagellar basal-body rod protein FlgB
VEPTLFSGGRSNAIGALTRALDATALRQETVAANLANINTPGYQRRDVAFALPPVETPDGIGTVPLRAATATLALARTNLRHFDGLSTISLGLPGNADPITADGAPHLVTDATGTAMRLDGNNVDPDAESARLAETEITFAALTQALSSQFGALRIAITGSASGR